MTQGDRSKKQRVADLFDEMAQPGWGVDVRFFDEIGRRMAKHADIRPGARVLDVAAGPIPFGAASYQNRLFPWR